MDLSRNICGLCCTVHPRALLAPLAEGPDTEFLSLLLGPGVSGPVLACGGCRGKVASFRQFWDTCRVNLARLRQVQGEHEMREPQPQPDSTWSRLGNSPGPEEESKEGPPLGIEISVSEGGREDFPRSNTDNFITITKIDKMETDEEVEKISQIREANRLRNVRYRERKRAREAELKNYFSCLSNLGLQTTALDLASKKTEPEDDPEMVNVTPDLSIVLNEEEGEEFEEEEGEDFEEESVRREEAVSPPPSSHQVPILVPSLATFPYKKEDTEVRVRGPTNPEERRRHRNREASRRYREKARGDPDLLRKMREQQNKRQKKYYARLKEKKQDPRGGKIMPTGISPWLPGLVPVLPYHSPPPLPPSANL